MPRWRHLYTFGQSLRYENIHKILLNATSVCSLNYIPKNAICSATNTQIAMYNNLVDVKLAVSLICERIISCQRGL